MVDEERAGKIEKELHTLGVAVAKMEIEMRWIKKSS